LVGRETPIRARPKETVGSPLKSGLSAVDSLPMRVWIKSVANLLGLEDNDGDSVRQILADAVQRSAEVGLGVDEAEVNPELGTGLIDAIDGEEIVISSPVGSLAFDLVPGTRIYIAVSAPRGFYRGECEAISRWVGRGENTRRKGYRVSVPKSLMLVQRRDSHRVPVAFDLAPRAIVRDLTGNSKLGAGTVLDLSESGIRLRLAPLREVFQGETLLVEASFPAEIPSFQSLAEVMYLAPSKVPDSVIVGLRFTEARPELGRAIRALDLKRNGRNAA